MNRDRYRFTFRGDTSMKEIRDTLYLAVMAVEALYGTSGVRLEAGFEIDDDCCYVNANTPAGQALARIIEGLLGRQLGDGCFSVDRIDTHVSQTDWRVGHA